MTLSVVVELLLKAYYIVAIWLLAVFSRIKTEISDQVKLNDNFLPSYKKQNFDPKNIQNRKTSKRETAACVEFNLTLLLLHYRLVLQFLIRISFLLLVTVSRGQNTVPHY